MSAKSITTVSSIYGFTLSNGVEVGCCAMPPSGTYYVWVRDRDMDADKRSGELVKLGKILPGRVLGGIVETTRYSIEQFVLRGGLAWC